MDISESMITRAMDAITFDPLQEIRADYAQLKAHYEMVNARGNELFAEARHKTSEAHEYCNEAWKIRQQYELLERLHPEVIKP